VELAFDLGDALGELIDGALLESLGGGELSGELLAHGEGAGHTGQLHEDGV
jgi:hypothetical protein